MKVRIEPGQVRVTGDDLSMTARARIRKECRALVYGTGATVAPAVDGAVVHLHSSCLDAAVLAAEIEDRLDAYHPDFDTDFRKV